MRHLLITVTFLTLLACNTKTKSTDNLTSHKSDTIYSERYFPIDSTSKVFHFFFKQGLIKGHYVHKMDCCEGELKTYTLFDKNGNAVFDFGLSSDFWKANRVEFDSSGNVLNELRILMTADTNHNRPAISFMDDSLILQTIIPMIEKRWMTIQDSLKNISKN